MKKLLIVLLTIVLVLGMSGTAFAIGDDNEYTDMGSITIKKVVNGSGNPEETFNFTIGAGEVLEGSAESAPVFSQNDFSITVGKGENEGSKDITLPAFNRVGKYSYSITETEGNTAGMVYDNSGKELIITVINDGDGGFIRLAKIVDVETEEKAEGFVNTFNAGDLKVNKVLEGNYTDLNDEFTVTVTLKPIGEKTLNIEGIVAVNGSVDTNEVTGEVTITYTVKGGNDFTIQNIPYDVYYSVLELENELGYTATYDGKESGEFKYSNVETTIRNTRSIEVPVGVTLENLPYILILVLAVGGLAIFVIRRRIFN